MLKKIDAIIIKTHRFSKPNVLQTGSALLEALIAVLIFSVGLLGMLKVQADSIVRSTDALYRIEANALAQELISIIWTDKSNAASYAHYGESTTCDTAVGAASTNANLKAWLTSINLPGFTAKNQMVKISTIDNSIRVRVCWRTSDTVLFSNVELVSQLP